MFTRPLVRLPASNNIVPFRPSGGGRNQRFPSNPGSPGKKSDAPNQTWNVKRPPGNPNGKPNRGGFNWKDALWRAGKEAFDELIRPPEIPELPIDLPEYNKWVRDENEKRGYPARNKFPDYGDFGPPEPEEPKVVEPEPETKRFPEMPDSPYKFPPSDREWQTNLPPGTVCTIEVVLEGNWTEYYHDYDTNNPLPDRTLTGSWRVRRTGTAKSPKSIGTTSYSSGTSNYLTWYVNAKEIIWKGFSNESPNPTGDFKKFYIPSSTASEEGGYDNFWRYAYTRNLGGYKVVSVTPRVTFIIEPSPSNQPLRTSPRTKPNNMQCQQCQARQMLREMSQTITVDSVTVTKIPTGDLLATTRKVPKRVFALPGTQDAVKDQFNIVAEIKRRTVGAFNQARRSKMMARLIQTTNVISFLLEIHNAMMLSRDIGQTFFSLIFSASDNLISTFIDLPMFSTFFEKGETFNTKQIIGKTLDDTAKKVFGVKKWNEIKATTLAFNRVVSSANTILQTSRALANDIGQLAELAAENSGKLANRLRSAGVLPDEGQWFAENYEYRSKTYKRIMALNDKAQGLLNAAQFFEQLTTEMLSIKNNITDLQKETRELENALEKLESTTRKDNKPVAKKDKSEDAKSRGSIPSDDDIQGQDS